MHHDGKLFLEDLQIAEGFASSFQGFWKEFQGIGIRVTYFGWMMVKMQSLFLVKSQLLTLK